MTCRDGATALFIASLYSSSTVALQMVRTLCDAGADKNKQSEVGATLLYVASQNNRIDVVQVLCDRQADLNKATETGATPLHIAAQQGNEEVVRVLCAAGADRNRKNVNGSTPMQIAHERRFYEIAKVLREPPLRPRQEPGRVAISSVESFSEAQLKQKQIELEEAQAKIKRLQQELEEASNHARGLHAGRSPSRGRIPVTRTAASPIPPQIRSSSMEKITQIRCPSMERVFSHDGQEVVEKIIEVPIPQVHVIEKVVEVPQVQRIEKVVEVPQVLYKDKFEYVPQIVYQEVIKQVPKVLTQEVVKQVAKFVTQEEYDEYMASMAGHTNTSASSSSPSKMGSQRR